MVEPLGKYNNLNILREKGKKIKLLLTDNDGVLTDCTVYYSANGEELKKYSLRDGMGVNRLRTILGIDTGIITGENSLPVAKRAEKLNIKILHLHIKNKLEVFNQILEEFNLLPENIAYIGDDFNDIEVIKAAGLTAAPKDAMPQVIELVDYVCAYDGGYGAFRDFAELIILLNNS